MQFYSKNILPNSLNGEKMVINTHAFDAIRGRQADCDFFVAMCTFKSVAKLFTFQDADIPAEQRAQRNATQI